MSEKKREDLSIRWVEQEATPLMLDVCIVQREVLLRRRYAEAKFLKELIFKVDEVYRETISRSTRKLKS